MARSALGWTLSGSFDNRDVRVGLLFVSDISPRDCPAVAASLRSENRAKETVSHYLRVGWCDPDRPLFVAAAHDLRQEVGGMYGGSEVSDLIASRLGRK